MRTNQEIASIFSEISVLMEFGLVQARRGWAKKKDVINTRSWPEMLKQLK